MADDMENIENTTTEDDGQISEDDWAAAMSEQAVAETSPQPTAQPADNLRTVQLWSLRQWQVNQWMCWSTAR